MDSDDQELLHSMPNEAPDEIAANLPAALFDADNVVSIQPCL